MSKIKLLQKIKHSINNRGIKGSLGSGYSYLYDYYFDIKFSIETHSWVEVDELDIEENKKKHAVLYQATRVLPLRRLFKELNFPQDITFVDIGCGKGRVLLIASEFGFKEVIGIEFSSLLCSIAEKNITTYSEQTNSKTSFLVLNLDILNYQYNDNEDVFFLYNPFDEIILEKVIQKITASLKRRNRRIWMIYANAIHKDIIENNLNIINSQYFDILGFDFNVYEVELLKESLIN